eukprot:943442-Amorphochlora_amoeboformis.AAC.2
MSLHIIGPDQIHSRRPASSRECGKAQRRRYLGILSLFFFFWPRFDLSKLLTSNQTDAGFRKSEINFFCLPGEKIGKVLSALRAQNLEKQRVNQFLRPLSITLAL